MNRPIQDTPALIKSTAQRSVAMAELLAKLQNSQGSINLAAIPADLALTPDQLAIILPYLDKDLSLEDLAAICGARGD